LVFATIVFVERRFTLKRGQAFALYVTMYTFGRIWFEALRIDDATRIFGVRFNLLLSILLSVFGAVWFVWLGRRPQPASPEAHGVAEPLSAQADEPVSDRDSG
jgi:prolipoprotein diacylglyceryltransferase